MNESYPAKKFPEDNSFWILLVFFKSPILAFINAAARVIDSATEKSHCLSSSDYQIIFPKPLTVYLMGRPKGQIFLILT